KYSQRSIITHTPGRLFMISEHGTQDHLNIFVGIAEKLLARKQCTGIEQRLLYGLLEEIGRSRQMLLQPLLIGLVLGQRGLDLMIMQEQAAFHIDRDHFARSEATLFNHLMSFTGHHASLGGNNKQTLISERITRRTQAIAIKSSAHDTTIGEDKR